MILAPTLSLNTPARGYDADATAFAAASGATDVAALSTFVKGVKELGLWSSMVCWPMRSTQNAGTGTTVYSLGGLGAFNGSFVNTPTWETNGVKRTASDDRYINVPSLSITATGQFSIVGCMALEAVADALQLQLLTVQYDSEPNLATGRLAIFTTTGGTRNLRVSASNTAVQEINREQAGDTTNIANDTFYFYGTSVGTHPTMARSLTQNGTSIGADGGSMASTWDAVGSNSAILRAQASGTGYTATASFVAFLSSAISASQQASFYTLYKSTLGTGLGLP
jgi:hypothetical protein